MTNNSFDNGHGIYCKCLICKKTYSQKPGPGINKKAIDKKTGQTLGSIFNAKGNCKTCGCYKGHFASCKR